MAFWSANDCTSNMEAATKELEVEVEQTNDFHIDVVLHVVDASSDGQEQGQIHPESQRDTENLVGASLSCVLLGSLLARHPCGQYSRKGVYFKAQTGPCPVRKLNFTAKNGSRFTFVENPLPNIPNPWKIFREDLKRVCDKESREVFHRLSKLELERQRVHLGEGLGAP